MTEPFLLPLPLLAALLILTALFFFKPFICFMLFAASIPFESSLVILPGFSLAKLLGLIALFSWILKALLTKKSLRINVLSVQLGVFLLIAVSAVFYVPEIDFQGVIQIAQCLMLALLVHNLVKTKRDLLSLTLVLSTSCLLCFFVSYLLQPEDMVREGRLSLLLEDQNESAFFAGGLILLLQYVRVINRGFKKEVIIYLLQGLLFLFFILTGSRGAFLAFIAAEAVILLFSGFSRGQKFFAFAGIFLAICFYIRMSGVNVDLPEQFDQYEPALHRLQEFVRGDEGGQKSPRSVIWERGITQYFHKPLTGYGMGSFHKLIGEASHNDFLRSFFEMGLAGGIVYVLIYAGAFLASVRHPSRATRYFLLAILCFCFVNAFFLGLLTAKFFWVLMSIVYFVWEEAHDSPKKKAQEAAVK